jgi:predicted outer membrane protein
MQHRMTGLFALGAAVAAMACATQPPATTVSRTTTTTTTTTSSGDVALNAPNGMWMDSVGGTWMDSSGGMWAGGPTGPRLGLDAGALRTMTDANIVAHLAAGDSLEVTLSQLGADRAQNTAARDFASRMVTEHSAHMQMSRQMAVQGGITPAPSPADTADAAMASRAISRLASTPAGPAFDRQLIGAEVMMHQHLLRELETVQPQATGAARQLVDQTIPVVRQHLADARAIWRQVGGGMGNQQGGRMNP